MPKELKSQHDKKYTLISDGIWMITWDKDTTSIANQYLDENKMPDKLNFIVDASQVPLGFFSLFAKPKMKKYKHPILFSFDKEYNQTLPHKEDMISLLYIQKSKIVKILYLKNINELEETFK